LRCISNHDDGNLWHPPPLDVDIVRGDVTVTLRLLWNLVLKFYVDPLSKKSARNRPSQRGSFLIDPKSIMRGWWNDSPYAAHLTLDSSLARRYFPNVPFHPLTHSLTHSLTHHRTLHSFKSGVGFCAIVHVHHPDRINFAQVVTNAVCTLHNTTA
jgi:hypothetical protein